MEKDNMDFIFEKTFLELSSDEKIEMFDLFTNEEEFNQIKNVLAAVNKNKLMQEKMIQPSSKIKTDLDNLFYKTYTNENSNNSTNTKNSFSNRLGIFFVNQNKNWYQQNIIKIAAVLILIISILPILNKGFRDEKSIQVAQVEQKENKSETKLKSLEIDSKNNEFSTINKSKINTVEENKNHSQLKLVDSDFDQSVTGLEDILTEKEEVKILSNHPDGIFEEEPDAKVFARSAYVESSNRKEQNSSFKLSQNEKLLDLITTCY